MGLIALIRHRNALSAHSLKKIKKNSRVIYNTGLLTDCASFIAVAHRPRRVSMS